MASEKRKIPKSDKALRSLYMSANTIKNLPKDKRIEWEGDKTPSGSGDTYTYRQSKKGAVRGSKKRAIRTPYGDDVDLQIDKLILCNGSMHIELSQLRTIQKLLKNKWLGKYVAKLTTYAIFSKNLRNVYFDKTKVSNNELKDMWMQLEYNEGRKVIHKLSQYINERYTYWNRWIGALKETNLQTNIVWAKNDPVAVPAIARLIATEISNNKL